MARLKAASVVSLITLVLGLALLGQSLTGSNETVNCVSGELGGAVTCVFPSPVTIQNYVHGAALVSINGGSPTRLVNGSVIASVITYMPFTQRVFLNNESQLVFNIFNPVGKWVNITLPGECHLTLNVTVLGSGYVSITALSNNKTVVYTPYTYSLITTITASDDLDIYVKPAIPLSCPCINTLVFVSINGTCTRAYTPTVEAVAYIGRAQVNWALLIISAILISASSVVSLINAFVNVTRHGP
jgi:hypothetical protein